jgi:hypothetical protein
MWHKGLVGVKMYRLELSRFFLGASSAGAKAALTTAGKWLGLGLDFEVKLGIDAAFAAAEAAYCYSQTQ